MASPAQRFLQTITYAAVSARDTYGKPTLGSQTTARARVEPSSKFLVDEKGDEHVATHVVYTEAPLTMNHRVWLPGANTATNNDARKPIKIEQSVDGAGMTRFRKVFF